MASRRLPRPPERARVKPVAYMPPAAYPHPIEVLSSSELCRRIERNDAHGVERVDFDCLIYVNTGRYRHMVDFEHFDCGAGSVLLVRPGQVHRFGNLTGWSGWMIIFRSEQVAMPREPLAGTAVESLHRLADAGALVILPTASRQATVAAVTQMLDDAALAGPSTVVSALIRHQLEALLVRIELAHLRSAADSTPSHPGLRRLRQFEAEIEREFRRWHTIGRYARRLRCSVKTLTRTALAIRGRSAKALVADRLVLEAKRLLVHSASPVAAIAETLGFEEATNFVKFFKRETRVTPGAFRIQHSRVA